MGSRSLIVPGSVASACYRAGQAFAKEQPGLDGSFKIRGLARSPK